MAEQDNVIAGEPIEASWGNAIRDRTLQRYADSAERASENPTPTAGEMSFLENTGEFSVYYSAGWRQPVPAGVIVAYGGASAPAGWLLCQGQEVSRSTYANLFNIIGTAYGSGNGSSTFNLPNLQQRFPLGKAASGTGQTLGGTGGAIDHVHTGPSHTHTGPSHRHTAPDHSHTYSTTTSAAPTAVGQEGSGPTFEYATAHTHTVPSGGTAVTNNMGTAYTSYDGTGDTGASGTGNTSANNPPYLVVNYLIKT